MDRIFSQVDLGNLTLRNRFVRSATWEGMCDDDGKPTEKLISLYEELAEGGMGLIITGYAFVRPEGKQNPWKLGIHEDALVPGLSSMVSRVHEKGGKVAAQIVHAGGQARREFSNSDPIAPSAVAFPAYQEMPKEMTPGDIEEVIQAFATAAGRARDAGFDAVQLHGAHGYLIAQFLSPLTNQRADEWGGSLENRSRFFLSAVRAVRERVGEGYPVLVKINCEDFLPGGFSFSDFLELLPKLEEVGVDGVEVSGGTPASGDKSAARQRIDGPEKEAYHRKQAAEAKNKISIPVILVGGVRSLDVMSRIFEEGGADLFSLSRPFIREPDLVSRWASGNIEKARCISCNGCFGPAVRGEGIRCVIEQG